MWLVPETREVSGPAWAKQTLQNQSECCQDQGRLHGSSIRDNLDFWWWSDCNGLCQDPRAIPPPAPLAPALLPSGARSCWVQEEHTPKVNWISPPRASAPAVWNLTLSLTGWLQWPNRREALPYTWFYSKPVSVSLLLFHSTHLLHFFFFRWKWHLRCHVRCLSMTYSLIIIISRFYSYCCKLQNFIF